MSLLTTSYLVLLEIDKQTFSRVTSFEHTKISPLCIYHSK